MQVGSNFSLQVPIFKVLGGKNGKSGLHTTATIWLTPLYNLLIVLTSLAIAVFFV